MFWDHFRPKVFLILSRLQLIAFKRSDFEGSEKLFCFITRCRFMLFGTGEDGIKVKVTSFVTSTSSTGSSFGTRSSRSILCIFLVFFKQTLCTKLENRREFTSVKQSVTLFVHCCCTTRVHSLNNDVVENHLSLCSLQDVFLHRVLCHKTINVHSILLSDTVSTGHRLKIVLRVPIGVEDHNSVGCLKVDSKPTSTSRENETEILRAVRVKVIHRLLSIGCSHTSIQSLVLEPS